MRSVFSVLLLLLGITVHAQSYTDSIIQFRRKYTEELLADKRAPVKPSQVKYLQFYVPDANYRVWATFTAAPGSKPFLVPTHSGKQKPYKEYGVLSFTINSTPCTLHVYQSVDLINEAAQKDYLFLPFTDMTNYETTFAGGRYIDLSVNDVKGGGFWLDFNKCYNPYCAYADGYSCPIPPPENNLPIKIEAGEKLFLH